MQSKDIFYCVAIGVLFFCVTLTSLKLQDCCRDQDHCRGCQVDCIIKCHDCCEQLKARLDALEKKQGAAAGNQSTSGDKDCTSFAAPPNSSPLSVVVQSQPLTSSGRAVAGAD